MNLGEVTSLDECYFNAVAEAGTITYDHPINLLALSTDFDVNDPQEG